MNANWLFPLASLSFFFHREPPRSIDRTLKWFLHPTLTQKSAFLYHRVKELNGFLEGLVMLGRNFSSITFMILEGKRIIIYFFIFPFLNLIVQMGGKRSSGISRFSNLLTHPDSLSRFDFDTAQMEVEGFDAQFRVINFDTITVCPHIPVCASDLTRESRINGSPHLCFEVRPGMPPYSLAEISRQGSDFSIMPNRTLRFDNTLGDLFSFSIKISAIFRVELIKLKRFKRFAK